jgi:hypothetical protein
VRGLQCTPRQLSLRVGEIDQLQRVWESLSAEARERVLRLLAGLIGRVVSVEEGSRDE